MTAEKSFWRPLLCINRKQLSRHATKHIKNRTECRSPNSIVSDLCRLNANSGQGDGLRGNEHIGQLARKTVLRNIYTRQSAICRGARAISWYVQTGDRLTWAPLPLGDAFVKSSDSPHTCQPYVIWAVNVVEALRSQINAYKAASRLSTLGNLPIIPPN